MWYNEFVTYHRVCEHILEKDKEGRKMSDTRAKVLIYLAAFLLLISPLLPLFITFGGGVPLAVMAEAAKVSEDTPLDNFYADEMRGLWIATVNNINFPSKKGLSKKALEKELSAIVDFASENGFNTIMFQVRPAADALYRSEIFPQSKYVSGTCGKAADGGFDCLSYLLKRAHEKGIDIYAWVNPLRVTSGSATYPETAVSALPESSPARQNDAWVKPYADGKLYFDAGIPEVRTLVASGVREICENYDIDGIIFDDYFYPYPKDGAEFDDSETFEKYGGEFEDIGDFRRDSVNKLVKESYDAVKEVDTDIRFGISPFGIWQNAKENGDGSATNGLSAYSEIYCDALAWAKGGYVDFLAPQLYWTFETASAPYGTLAEWWSRALDGTGVDLYINHGVYRYDEGKMDGGELTRQVDFARKLYSYRGSMYYGYAALSKNSGGVCDEISGIFGKNYGYYDYVDDGAVLTIDSYESGDVISSETALIFGRSNLAYPISVNGITPLRDKEGNYSITLALRRGENLVIVSNGSQKCEILINRK